MPFNTSSSMKVQYRDSRGTPYYGSAGVNRRVLSREPARNKLVLGSTKLKLRTLNLLSASRMGRKLFGDRKDVADELRAIRKKYGRATASHHYASQRYHSGG